MTNPAASDVARLNRVESMTRSAPTLPHTGGSSREYEGRTRDAAAATIRLDRIIPDPDQPRTEFDAEALALLAESIRVRGQLQPIRVRWNPGADRYVVVVGERRYRAALLAGLESVACVVAASSATPEDILEDQLVENALRVDLRPVEQARAYRALMERRGLTREALATRLHVSPGSVSKALALLSLPERIRDRVEAGSIPPDTAYELSLVSDPAQRDALADRVAAGLARRDDVKAARRPAGKGRGGRTAKVTARTFRTAAGPRVSVEWARGLTPDALVAALEEAAAAARNERPA